jgi:hypothetical protein
MKKIGSAAIPLPIAAAEAIMGIVKHRYWPLKRAGRL